MLHADIYEASGASKEVVSSFLHINNIENIRNEKGTFLSLASCDVYPGNVAPCTKLYFGFKQGLECYMLSYSLEVSVQLIVIHRRSDLELREPAIPSQYSQN